MCKNCNKIKKDIWDDFDRIADELTREMDKMEKLLDKFEKSAEKMIKQYKIEGDDEEIPQTEDWIERAIDIYNIMIKFWD